MEEKRDYLRIPFKCHSQINVANQSYPCTLLDISLRGLLLAVTEPTVIELGTLCQIDIAFVTGGIHLQFDAKLVHRVQDHYGFKIEALDIDSLAHLRRLLELNYGDADEIDQELFYWLRHND
ncbi:MAG: PilZ domain-containing protein [Desulfuromonadales bacterium]|nr:PilZ domain-containing protein [Desulfuromonadales bacterium]